MLICSANKRAFWEILRKRQWLDYASNATDLDHLQAQTLALVYSWCASHQWRQLTLTVKIYWLSGFNHLGFDCDFYTLVKKAQQDAKQKSKFMGNPSRSWAGAGARIMFCRTYRCRAHGRCQPMDLSAIWTYYQRWHTVWAWCCRHENSDCGHLLSLLKILSPSTPIITAQLPC